MFLDSYFRNRNICEIRNIFLITHSALIVSSWWKNSHIFSRISLPSSGHQILCKIQEFFHHKLTVSRMYGQEEKNKLSIKCTYIHTICVTMIHVLQIPTVHRLIYIHLCNNFGVLNLMQTSVTRQSKPTWPHREVTECYTTGHLQEFVMHSGNEDLQVVLYQVIIPIKSNLHTPFKWIFHSLSKKKTPGLKAQFSTQEGRSCIHQHIPLVFDKG